MAGIPSFLKRAAQYSSPVGAVTGGYNAARRLVGQSGGGSPAPTTGYQDATGTGMNDAMAAWGMSQTNPPKSGAYNTAYGVYGAPEEAAANLQLAQLMQSLGLTNANQKVQSDYLNKQLGFQGQNNALDQNNLALQGTDLANQGRALDENFHNNAQGINLQAGDLFRQMEELGPQEELLNKLFGLQEGALKSNTDQSIRRTSSEALARGGYGSVGNAADVTDLNTALASDLDKLKINKEQSANDFMSKRLGLQSEQDKTKLGFDAVQNKYGYDKASLAVAKSKLDNEAKRLGISNQEATARIQNALDQLGIGTAADVNGIMLEMAKVEQGLVSSLPPQILSAIQALTGMGVK